MSMPTKRGRSCRERASPPLSHRAGVPVTLICDSMAAVVMAQGKIDAVIVGADRIAANGDTANTN